MASQLSNLHGKMDHFSFFGWVAMSLYGREGFPSIQKAVLLRRDSSVTGIKQTSGQAGCTREDINYITAWQKEMLAVCVCACKCVSEGLLSP